MNRLFLASAMLLSFTAAGSASTIITPTEDVMTSSFFQGANQVRGYAGDARPTFRVSSDNAFGVGPETVYIAFDAADFIGFTNPVANAVLTVESASGNFGADAGPGNPFNVSAHGVNADPLTSIADDTSTGTISASDFFTNNILPADAAAITAVDGFGPFQFDVTALVNDWLSGANTIFTLALTGKNDVQVGDGFLHGFRNNSDTLADEGFTFLTVTEVPEPSSVLIVLCMGLVISWWIVRPARRMHAIH